MLMLILLYFIDYKGAFWGTAAFAAGTVVFSVVSLFFPSLYLSLIHISDRTEALPVPETEPPTQRNSAVDWYPQEARTPETAGSGAKS